MGKSVRVDMGIIEFEVDAETDGEVIAEAKKQAESIILLGSLHVPKGGAYTTAKKPWVLTIDGKSIVI